MVMDDNRDELIVRKFFEENKVDIPDDGFSRRVMRRLPDRARRLNRIWTAVCVLSGLLLAAKCGWIGALVTCFCDFFANLDVHLWLVGRPCLVWLLLLSAIFLGGYKVLAEE